jgi:perosamine synthetase
MIFTDDDEYARKATMIRSHGEDPNKKYWHPMLGHNYRMTDVHASIGLAQFSRIDKLLDKRTEVANYYSDLLTGFSGVTPPTVQEGCKHSWFIYPVLVDNRDAVKKILQDNGVETNVSWPYPAYEQLHLNKFKKAVLPVTENITSSIIGLPMFYAIKKEQQKYVVEQLKKAVNNS